MTILLLTSHKKLRINKSEKNGFGYPSFAHFKTILLVNRELGFVTELSLLLIKHVSVHLKYPHENY